MILHHKDPRMADVWSWKGKIFFAVSKGKKIAKPFLSLYKQLSV